MIIGNGLIASSVLNIDSPKYLFFASGVSDSREKDVLNFKREKDLVEKSIIDFSDKILIYFSTVSVHFSNSDYVKHKIEMENIILNSGINYCIFRLPQILGKGGNPKNIINFIKQNILNDVYFNLNTKAERSILDIDDLNKIVKNILESNNINKVFDIAGIEYKNIIDIVFYIEDALKKKSLFNEFSNEDFILKTNSNDIELCIIELGLRVNNYTKNTIMKYIK
jgi:nucleoside-diphosphate-sugar epimerase